MLPKDGKIIRPVRNFLILTVRELPFCLSYSLFGSLIPGYECKRFMEWSSSLNDKYRLIFFWALESGIREEIKNRDQFCKTFYSCKKPRYSKLARASI
jgi:hypothetical protein